MNRKLLTNKQFRMKKQQLLKAVKRPKILNLYRNVLKETIALSRKMNDNYLRKVGVAGQKDKFSALK